MAVSAADVKKLRDLTGAGMMDCKRALEEADGDFDKAVEILRVKQGAKVARRGSEREATNGLVAAAEGAMIALHGSTMSWQMRDRTRAVSYVFSIIGRAGMGEGAEHRRFAAARRFSWP